MVKATWRLYRLCLHDKPNTEDCRCFFFITILRINKCEEHMHIRMGARLHETAIMAENNVWSEAI